MPSLSFTYGNMRLRRGRFVAGLFAMLLFLLPISAGAQDEAESQSYFVDGFPDVPLLSVVAATLGEPVVFDTPAGTVATVNMALSASFDEAARAYETALKSLGWVCVGAESVHVCSREGSKLSLSELNDEGAKPAMTMRLEPQ